MKLSKDVAAAVIVSVLTFQSWAAATVSDVRARQRYPWNGMIDIDYTITGDATGLLPEIKVEDRQSGKTYAPTKFLSVVPTEEGRHRVTWSTEAEGVTIISTNVLVTVSLVNPDPSAIKNNLYYVVDLSGGPTASRYPVSTMSVPDGVSWSDEYKTTKLVLRRIEAGADPLGRYTITKPFYIGVFEVTLKQWMLVMDDNPDSDWNGHGDKAAVCFVSYNAIRGSSLGAGWPFSAVVDANSFLGVLRNKTSLNLDLPTEAQWEYACRAGTTSTYNNGGNNEADLCLLGRYSRNQNDGRGGYSGLTTVGSYAPNAWGLYDMHGNVWEWCLDWYDHTALKGEDPIGPAKGSGWGRAACGGCYDCSASGCTSSSRDGDDPSFEDYDRGFRLACSAGL